MSINPASLPTAVGHYPSAAPHHSLISAEVGSPGMLNQAAPRALPLAILDLTCKWALYTWWPGEVRKTALQALSNPALGDVDG